MQSKSDFSKNLELNLKGLQKVDLYTVKMKAAVEPGGSKKGYFSNSIVS